MEYLAFLIVVVGVAFIWLSLRPKARCRKCGAIMRVYKDDPETRYTNEATYGCLECGYTEHVVRER